MSGLETVITSVSGWVVALLLPAATALPFLLRRGGQAIAGGAPIGRRWRRHFWLGYAIAALALIHAAYSTGTGLALRAAMSGIYLATGALLLVFAQVFVGLLLREPSLRNRPALRRRHFWGMAAIVVLVLGHIALNSALLHGHVR